MTTTSNTTTTLNNLIEICKDGQDGFRDAAEKVTNPELKTLFSKYSLQRSRFAGELQAVVTNLGEEPGKKGSAASAVHRGWLNLKSALTKGGDHPILAECERGEDYAVEAYRTALAEKLPANIRELVIMQSTALQTAHDDMRERRDFVAV